MWNLPHRRSARGQWSMHGRLLLSSVLFCVLFLASPFGINNRVSAEFFLWWVTLRFWCGAHGDVHAYVSAPHTLTHTLSHALLVSTSGTHAFHANSLPLQLKHFSQHAEHRQTGSGESSIAPAAYLTSFFSALDISWCQIQWSPTARWKKKVVVICTPFPMMITRRTPTPQNTHSASA